MTVCLPSHKHIHPKQPQVMHLDQSRHFLLTLSNSAHLSLTNVHPTSLQVTRLEQSRRFLLTSSRPLTEAEKVAFAGLVHDRMTEEIYAKPATSFMWVFCERTGTLAHGLMGASKKGVC